MVYATNGIPEMISREQIHIKLAMFQVSWLLMPWGLFVSPRHWHPRYCLCRISNLWSYTRKDFKYLCHVGEVEWYKLEVFLDLCITWHPKGWWQCWRLDAVCLSVIDIPQSKNTHQLVFSRVYLVFESVSYTLTSGRNHHWVSWDKYPEELLQLPDPLQHILRWLEFIKLSAIINGSRVVRSNRNVSCLAYWALFREDV